MWLEKDFLQHVYGSVALKLDNACAHAPQDGTKWSREAGRTGPEQTPASVQIQSISQCDQRQMCSIKRGERERERRARLVGNCSWEFMKFMKLFISRWQRSQQDRVVWTCWTNTHRCWGRTPVTSSVFSVACKLRQRQNINKMLQQLH